MDKKEQKKFLHHELLRHEHSISSKKTVRFEEEMEEGMGQDDDVILSKRYEGFVMEDLQSSGDTHQQQLPPNTRLQSQWTRIADAVQEHFCSHVIIEGEAFKLPKEIYAMKVQAKNTWVLYKKRECERRKRIRRKLQKEKEKECSNQPSNLLLALVDRCEACKRFYVTVNLFWGVTLCDSCYFNEGTIYEIMQQQREKIGIINPIGGITGVDEKTIFELKRRRMQLTEEENSKYYKTKKPPKKRQRKLMENPFSDEEHIVEEENDLFYHSPPPAPQQPPPPPPPVVEIPFEKRIEDIPPDPSPDFLLDFETAFLSDNNNGEEEEDEDNVLLRHSLEDFFPIHFEED